MSRRRLSSAHTDLFGTQELVGQTRCAVIVAHPDDEVIGAGGLLSRLKDVAVLHVTDGAPAGEDFVAAGFKRRSDYARERSRQCRTALALANVPPDRIVEFGLGDQQAPHYLAELTKKVATFVHESAPSVVLTHPFEGGHPDHDATAFATHAALHLLRRNGFEPPAVFEMALHPAPDGTGRVLDFFPGDASEVTTLILDEETRALKVRMLECLTAQPLILRDSPISRERFRRPPQYDFASPAKSLPTEMLRGEISGDEWQSLVRQAWTELFPEEARGQ